MSHTLTQESATALLNAFLPVMQREQGTTKLVIQAIPLDKGDYRPDPNAKTALELAWHIAAAEKRFYNGIADGGFDFSPINKPDSIKTSADIAQWYGEMCDAVQPRLVKMTTEQLGKIVDFRGALQMPAVMFFQIAINHSVHHRGQLSVYLRPMGGKVPAIYGESYDSAEAKKMAQSKTA
jgi:uncharacterized damage-inducible protein DinB